MRISDLYGEIPKKQLKTEYGKAKYVMVNFVDTVLSKVEELPTSRDIAEEWKSKEYDRLTQAFLSRWEKNSMGGFAKDLASAYSNLIDRIWKERFESESMTLKEVEIQKEFEKSALKNMIPMPDDKDEAYKWFLEAIEKASAFIKEYDENVYAHKVTSEYMDGLEKEYKVKFPI